MAAGSVTSLPWTLDHVGASVGSVQRWAARVAGFGSEQLKSHVLSSQSC
jgi:hypothetical protein